jgi:hypothetical protein
MRTRPADEACRGTAAEVQEMELKAWPHVHFVTSADAADPGWAKRPRQLAGVVLSVGGTAPGGPNVRPFAGDRND